MSESAAVDKIVEMATSDNFRCGVKMVVVVLDNGAVVRYTEDQISNAHYHRTRTGPKTDNKSGKKDRLVHEIHFTTPVRSNEPVAPSQ